jgi:hypothetical protein
MHANDTSVGLRFHVIRLSFEEKLKHSQARPCSAPCMKGNSDTVIKIAVIRLKGHLEAVVSLEGMSSTAIHQTVA